MPLTPTRIRILRRLAERNLERDGAETAEDITIALEMPSVIEVLRALSALYQDDLARAAGKGPGHQRTWTITPQGRAALAAAEEGA